MSSWMKSDLIPSKVRPYPVKGLTFGLLMSEECL